MSYRLTLYALLLGTAFYLGIACQTPRIVIHERIVSIERPTYLPTAHTARVRHSVDVIGAVIPASALTRYVKRK